MSAAANIGRCLLAGAVPLALGCATARRFDPALETSFYTQTVTGLTGGSSPLSADPNRLDYTRLRRARRLAGGEPTAPSLATALHEARSRRDAAASLRAAHQLLERDFTDAEAHMEKARLLHSRDGGAAAFHERLALGLLRSMVEGAELDDRARPFRLHSGREEEALLMFLNLSPVLRWSEQHLQVVETRDGRGRTRRLYLDRR